MKRNRKQSIKPILADCQKQINKIMKKDIPIVYLNTRGSINGLAHKIIKFIELKGDWSDLLSDDKQISEAAKMTLFYTIGHELGHLDQEPSILYPDNSIIRLCSALVVKDFRSQIREIRADFCGVLFALNALNNLSSINTDNRQYIIETVFNYEIKKHGKDKESSTHPSFSKRELILTENLTFDQALVESLSNDYKCSHNDVEQLCSCAFDGTLLKLQDKLIVNDFNFIAT